MAFVKKEVDIEALMAQAAAYEAEKAQAAAAPSPRKKKEKKERPPKEKKERPPKEKKEKDNTPKKSSREKKEEREKKKIAKKRAKQAKKSKRVQMFSVMPVYEGEDDDELPSVYVNLISVLEDKATVTQGLFRQTASTALVQEMIDRFDAGEDIEWGEIEDTHLVGGVLMGYLLRLPEPLITFSAYDELITLYDSLKKTDVEKWMTELHRVVSSLPQINIEMLDVLLDFLDTMTRDAEDNLMTADNLAICFGPALMHRKEENLQQLMREANIVTETVTAFIEHFGYFFRDEELDLEQQKSGVSRETSVDHKASVEIRDLAKETLDAIPVLEDAVSRVAATAGELEFTKLWNTSSMSNLLVIESMLTAAIKEEAGALSKSTLAPSADAVYSKFQERVESKGVPMTCAEMKQKFGTILSTLKEFLYRLQQGNCTGDEITHYLRAGESTIKVYDVLGDRIKPEVDASAKDINVVITLSPIIKTQIEQLKKELDGCKVYADAVPLSRAIRGAQKAMKEKSRTPLEEDPGDRLPPSEAAASKATPADKRKLETLSDTLEFVFPACKKAVTAIETESQDPSKQNEVVRNAQLLSALYEYLYQFAPVPAPPGIVTIVPKNKPPPIAAHPAAAKAPPPIASHPSAPPPIAAHPAAAKAPPPIAAHPAASKPVISPKPIAPHPSQANSKAPPPLAPHPSASSPKPIAPHPSQVKAPPPIPAHPKGSVGAPPPIAPHPSQAKAPPPVAPHPSQTAAPPPIAPHPSESSKAPPPIAPHPAKTPSWSAAKPRPRQG